MQHKLLHPRRLFTLFKIGVYSALLLNLWLFLQEDMQGASVWADGASSVINLVEAFAQTIDTLAWVLLLLLFELETSFLSDSALRSRRVRWSLHGLRALCAVVIFASVVGYTGKLQSYEAAMPFAGDACALEEGWSVLSGHDEQSALDPDTCTTVDDAARVLPGVQVVAPSSVLEDATRLAWVDVINALAWVLVVILLEVDVRLQLKGRYEGWILRASAAAKFLTYAVLMVAAVYWGVAGDFLDFWDAFLWLVAFAFIELNLLQWHQEDQRLAHQPLVRSA